MMSRMRGYQGESLLTTETWSSPSANVSPPIPPASVTAAMYRSEFAGATIVSAVPWTATTGRFVSMFWIGSTDV